MACVRPRVRRSVEPAQVTPMNAAATFDSAARVILKARGERASGRAIAEIVGESAAPYSSYVRGEHNIGTDKLHNWLQAWSTSGRPELVMVLDTDGWSSLMASWEAQNE